MEGKDKLGKLKLRICLDPTNLNKAIVCEPYHFKTPEDFAHLLAEATIITMCDYKKGVWYQQLHDASSFLTTFNTELYSSAFWNYSGQWCVLVQVRWMFWHDQASNHHRWHNDCWVQARPQWSWPSLHQPIKTAQKCNVKLNYDKLQYKQDEMEFFGETYTISGCKPSKVKVSAIPAVPYQPIRSR